MRRETRVQLVLPDVHGEKLSNLQCGSVNTARGSWKLELYTLRRTPGGETSLAGWPAPTQEANWQC